MTTPCLATHAGRMMMPGLMAAALMTALPPAARAASEQVPIGARANAMGGAFSSIADDATALFWNPAGLPTIGHQEIMGTHANLFGAGINDNVLAFVLPLSFTQAVAADWYHSGFNDTELAFGESRFDLSYGIKMGSRFSAGATLKYLRRDVSLDGSSVRSGGGAGLDLGLLATPLDNLQLALVGQDVTDTRIDYGMGGGGTVVFPRNMRGAASYRYRHRLTLATDVDDRWHVGLEYAPLEMIELRAGVEDDRHGNESATYSTGVGFKVGVFRLDYAYVMPPELEATSHFSAALQFDFNPSQVRIVKVEPHDVYASLYKTYTKDPFVSVEVRNLSKKSLEARFSVDVPELMDAPSETTIVLRSGATDSIPLPTVLSSKVMSQRGNQKVQVRVATRYQSVRLPRTDKGSGPCFVFGPGALTWDDGVAPAAAFITSADPAVGAFAREACRIVSAETALPFDNQNLAFTAAVIDALGSLGIAYVPDPRNPYSRMSGTRGAVDTVQYPRETLAKRTGDCDDTTVLVAALLENIGISTKLIEIPGHIFLMADTGIPEQNRLVLGVPEALYTIRDHELWIPLETTSVGRGFPSAWREGAQTLEEASARGTLSLVDVDSALTRFEPGDLPATDLPPPPAPVAAQLDARILEDLRTVEAWRSEYRTTRFGDVENNLTVTASARAEIARVHFLAGDMDESRTRLEEGVQRDSASATLRNDLGVCLIASGDVPRSRAQIEAAARLDPSDAGVWLNLGLVADAAGDSVAGGRFLSEGIARAGSVDDACRLLGLSTGVSPVPAGGLESAAARTQLRAALRKARLEVAAREPGGVTPGPKGEIIDLAGFMYWKKK